MSIKISKRIKTNFKYIKKLTIKYISILFTILGSIAVFFPINEYISNSIYKIVIIILIIVLTNVLAILKTILTTRVQIFSKNGKKIIVEYGDIFSEKYKSNGAVIGIPVNRCFDTIVNDELISSDKLHGKVINKIRCNSELEYNNMNKKIQLSLEKQEIKYEQLKNDEKKQGNLKRYPVGTIVQYNAIERNFYFIGLSKFDRELHAQYTEQEHILTIQKLIEYHSIYGNGKDLIIPIIGGGNTGTNKKEKTILDMMIELIKFNSNLINSNISIIVRESAKNEVSIYDL
jgi:predicted membrane protein